jgi:hypothetical protein
MADIQLLLEAERRGLLPPDRQALLEEARRRGLIEGGAAPMEQAPKAPERPGFFGSFFESAKTLGIADEASVYASNPNDENRRKLLDAAKSKYESVGFGQGENWEAFKELLGGSLGQLVAPAIAATGTALLTRKPTRAVQAGMATSAAQYEAQNVLRQAQEQEAALAEGRAPEQFSLSRSVISSAGQTALDYAGFQYFKPLFEAFPLLRNLVGAGDEAAETAAKTITDAAERGAIKSTRYGTVLIEGAKGAAFEVPQEVAQQALERWQAGLSLTDEDAREEFKQAAIGAAILGPLMGGAKGFVSSSKPEEVEEETTDTQPPPPPPGGDETTPAGGIPGIPPEAFAEAQDYMSKVDNNEIFFNLFKARKLIRNMGYEVSDKSKLAETKALLNDILTAKTPDLGMLATGEFADETEVPSGSVTTTTPAGETVTEPTGGGDVVPPSGIGAAEPGVTEPTGAGVVSPVVAAEEPDAGETELRPALKRPDYGVRAANNLLQFARTALTTGAISNEDYFYISNELQRKEVPNTAEIKRRIFKAAKSMGMDVVQAKPKLDKKYSLSNQSDRDALSHIADLMLQEAPSDTESMDYAVDQIDPLGLQKEQIKAKPGMNARRMAKMMGPQLYGDPVNMGAVTIKEILQNSFDSIKGLIDAGQLEKGKIDIEVDPESRTIDMYDNGAGMAPELLATKFLEIAGTGKDAKTPSGGFGIAKMLFLYGNKGIRVVSMKDGKVSEMVTDGDTLFDALENPDAAPNILVRKPTATDYEMFPDGHGVYISLQIPENYVNPQNGELKDINFPTYAGEIPGLMYSPLFSDIDVTFNNKQRTWRGREQLDIGSKFPQDKFGEFANVKFPWGNARIYVAESPDTRYGSNLHVLSNGLYQFSQRLQKNPMEYYGDPIPFEFYVDIKPTVKPDEVGYPFTFNRQDFTEQAKSEYNKVIRYINALYAYQNLSNEAKGFGSVQYFDSPTSTTAPVEIKPTVPPQQTAFAGIQKGDKVTVEDGKLFVRGRELPELTTDDLRDGIPSTDQLKVDPSMIDPSRIMLHDNVQFKASGQDFSSYMREQYGSAYDSFMYEVGDVFQQLRKDVAKVLEYPELMNEAIGLSIDQEYRGVSIRVPFSGSFVDPFASESTNIIEAALGTFGTMIHELAHHKVRSHNANFPAEMQKIIYKLRALEHQGMGQFDALEKRLVNAFQNNQAVFKEGWRIINEGSRDGSIEPRGNRFEDSSREDIRKPEGAGVPEGERGPSREGRAGKPVQPKPVSGARPTQAGRPAQPTPGAAAAGPTDKRGQTPEQAIKTRQDTYKQRYSKASIVDRILKYLSGKDAGSKRLDKFEALVRKFQNELRPALLVERALKRAGELITYGPGMNDAYTKITNAQDKAAWLTSTMLKIPMDRAYKAIEKYAKSRGLTTDQAIEELDRFRIVLHEPERRMVMFMRYAPLSTKRRAFRDSNGRTIQISPAELREEILKSLVKPGNDLVSNGQAKQLNRLLKSLVSDKNNLDPLGASPIKKEGKPLSIDINDDQYSVLGGYSPAFIAKWADTFNSLGTQKATAEAAIKAIEDVQDVTKELNRMAKYWSQPVENIVAFYDFQHYTPFKGVPGTKVRAEAEMTDPNDVRISGEFADADQAMEGRESEADNSVLQSLSDALYAASRAGRAGVTEAVKNLIEQGHISGRKVAEITHEQRYLDRDFDFKKFRGKNKLFHYNDAGNIEVYEIANKDLDFLESIRRPYQVDNWATKMGNNITGFFGQMHTRFNPSFAPLNFPRDIFTNTLAISADVGGKEAAQYLSDSLFRNVMKGGLYKSGVVSKLIQEGNINELRRLAKTDPFYNDVIEWMEEGGRTTYQQVYSMQAQADELEAMLGPNGVVRPGVAGWEAVKKWSDIYNDAFEFTNRVAAYGVMKGNVMARLKQEFRDKNNRAPNAQELSQIEKAAKTEAASFAKNLANFRLIGTAGREAGALFMFFRAGATGAVRAIDAIMPALVDEKTALSKAPASIRDNPEAAKRFLKNYRENKRRAQYTILATAAAGAFLYGLALAGADDDDQGRNSVATDDMARWTRYARLPVLGKDTFLQIPWGFGISAFGAIGAQVAALGAGNESGKDFAANVINIAFDSFIPLPKSNINIFDNFTAFLVDSVTPSALRPVVEYAMNTDNLGNEIYNSRQSRYSDVFTGGSNVPDMYKDMARLFFDVTNYEVSPNSMYFWATNYADALNRVATSTYDLRLFATGQRELRSVDDLDKTLVPLDSFIGTRSNYDARQYQDVKDQIEKKQRLLKSLELRPDAYRRYIENYPTDPEIVAFYNQAINGELKTLQEHAKYIRLSSKFTAQERRDLLKQNTRMQNLAKRNLIDTFKFYGIEPED